ncbi:MAG TPA: hypothetical protein VI197_06135 [Polyangiaceae bacterium]
MSPRSALTSQRMLSGNVSSIASVAEVTVDAPPDGGSIRSTLPSRQMTLPIRDV